MNPQEAINSLFAQNRQLAAKLAALQGEFKGFMEGCKNQPQSVQEEINTIEGRRVPYGLVGTQTFTATQDGQRAAAINMLVSQDGPFIWTHFPMVSWRPSAPAGATNFGRWSPIASWPLPTQQSGANTDIINLSYEMVDGGSQRNLQNSPMGNGPFSRPDNIVPLPEWSVVAPNAVLQFVPTYEDIAFAAGAATPATGGTLVVICPGFRVVNM